MPDESCYMIVERVPSPEEYIALRKQLALPGVPREAIERGLAHSLYSICVVHEDEVVGLGRIIGDGGLYFYIQDFMVAPDFKDMGIGQCIMDKLMDYLKENAPAGAFFCVKADGDIPEYCKQFGFKNF